MAIVAVKLEGLEQVQGELRDVAENQIPFATALTLTRVAQDAQKVVQSDVLPAKFTLRQPSFLKKGVRVTAATKQNLFSVVEDIDKFMQLQEEGGTKLPFGKYLAIPIVGGARRSQRALIATSDMPSALMANGAWIEWTNGGRVGVMFIRKVKQARRSSRKDKATGERQVKAGPQYAQITPMYVLVPRATVKARYQFVHNVLDVVSRVWRGRWDEAFKQAVRTASK
ncbi:hypothetical protein Acid345_3187 [Candidatus Koribacter versatilis Ellin345]|uniref:Uncharacterized protein n=1 Tax=Koribacter versatilis (strain Ellin345) TaxID=204669 RepID=Q1ILR2_KORVE|nr:hypothetical protein [Candidatus Koribacter versatilis]ABF42188.1 hypothetical protein Acid345_3187 [Candidatus Koribacter versatilis Ellin345]